MTTSRVTVSVDATGERHRVEAFRRGIEAAVADLLAGLCPRLRALWCARVTANDNDGRRVR